MVVSTDRHHFRKINLDWSGFWLFLGSGSFGWFTVGLRVGLRVGVSFIGLTGSSISVGGIAVGSVYIVGVGILVGAWGAVALEVDQKKRDRLLCNGNSANVGRGVGWTAQRACDLLVKYCKLMTGLEKSLVSDRKTCAEKLSQ